MAKKVMYNVREKLSKSRELCAGMSERAYLLADYMSEISPDTISPLGLAVCLIRAVRDISQERRWMKIAKKEELRYQLLGISRKIRNQAENIPQIIDVIADEDFAEEFRVICKEKFDFDPPKYGTSKKLEEYPEYVKVAVKWWSSVLFCPKLDTPGSAVPSSLASIIKEEVNLKSYSLEELLIFEETLASEIMEDITAWGVCTLSVDYHPCEELKFAGDKVGVHQVFGYPLKTSMEIWKYKVEVRVGVGREFKTIWTSN